MAKMKDKKRYRPTVDCSKEPMLTKQSMKDECDVNFIMNNWKRTGVIPAAKVGSMPPSYGDFTNPSDYMTACNQVIEAKDAFASLPSFLRDRFANEPANLLRFLDDPDNQAEAVKLGLANAPKTPDPSVETPTAHHTPEGEPEG